MAGGISRLDRFIWVLSVTTLLLTQTTGVELVIGEIKVYLYICLLMFIERHRWPSETQTRILPGTGYIVTDAASFGFGHFITFCGITWRMGEVSLAEQVGLYRSNFYSARCRFEFQIGYGLS